MAFCAGLLESFWQWPLIAGVDADGPGPKVYVPATAGQFATLGITAPDSLWLCQEASGNLADTIGVLTLTANGTPHYAQTVTGWTRKAVTLDDASNDRFQNNTGSSPDPATTSVLFIGYIDVTATPAATRKIWGMNSANPIGSQVTSASALRGVDAGNNATGGNIVNGGVRPITVMLNRAASVALIADTWTKLLPTYSGSETAGNLGLGGNAAGDSAPCALVWGAMWKGANAELTAAQVKTRLQTLRWPISWS